MQALARIVDSGEAMLFTGAGFSADACDLDGRCLPDSREMIAELWEMVFGEGDPDDSSLADLYDVALLHANDKLCDYVSRRLRIGETPLPEHYRAWFGAPWKRIYTLNVDDLEVAVAQQFALPRKLRSVSAIAPERSPVAPDALDVVHLNGLAATGAEELTFSTMQYAARLSGRDREYERLAEDLERAPFVFAGTTLDEVILWQHLELRRHKRPLDARRRPAFLISPALSRARQVLLESLGIEWVKATIAETAHVLMPG